MTSKKDLSERDICTKFITPALEKETQRLRNELKNELAASPGKGK